jgi:Flp pilus assembly protein TadG
LLPLLAFLFVIAIDFARIYYYSLTLQNCAWAGALYARDPHVADESPFANAEDAALADAVNISPAPTISQSSGTDATGRSYTEVTAAYQFDTLTAFPGVPSQLNLERSIRMYEAAIKPDVW